MNDDVAAAPKSKSQRKRELQALQDLGRQLLDLAQKDLARIPISERLGEAVLEARNYRRGALRRQLQFIGKLMIGEDVTAIRHALETISRPHRQEVETLHELEQWRDRLIDGDDALLDEICERFEMADRQHLRQLARNAFRQRQKEQPPKSARSLFHYLGELRAGEEGGDG